MTELQLILDRKQQYYAKEQETRKPEPMSPEKQINSREVKRVMSPGTHEVSSECWRFST